MSCYLSSLDRSRWIIRLVVFTIATFITIGVSAQADKRGLNDKTGIETDLNSTLRWQMVPDIVYYTILIAADFHAVSTAWFTVASAVLMLSRTMCFYYW